MNYGIIELTFRLRLITSLYYIQDFVAIKKTIISFVHHFPSLISTASQMDLNVSSHMRLNVSTLYSTCQLQIGRASIVHRKCSFTLHLSIICSLSTYHHNSVSGYISQHHAIISTCQCSFGANWSAASQRTHAIQRAACSHAPQTLHVLEFLANI